MNVYDQGDTIRFTAKVSKAELASAPTMTLIVGNPAGYTETVAATASHTGTDWKFTADFYVSPTASLGKWKYRFTASGSAAQVESGEFLIRAPLV